MNNLNIDKRWLIWGGAILVVVIVLAMLLAVEQQGPVTKKQPTNQAKTTKDSFKKTEVPATKLPEKFPADIPIETGAKITQNYNVTAKDGRFQATRVFETVKSLEENFNLYKNFFTKNSWEILTTLNKVNVKFVAAKKGNTQAQVNINENTITKAKTIDITVIITNPPVQ